MGAAAFDQDAFRGRNDDVGLNSATFNGGGGLNGNWTQLVDTNFRVRFVIQETAGGMGSNLNLDIWFAINGGSYAQVGAATAVRYADTTQYTNGATTTQVIGSGTYTSGDSAGGVDNSNISGNIDIQSEEAEVEYVLQIDSGQVSHNDTITLRVRNNGSVLDTYTNTPTITVNEPATTAFDQDSFRGRDDDVALNSGTFNGGGGLNGNWTQLVDTNFRIRFLIQADAVASADQQFELWYSINSGAYAVVTASTPIQPVATGQYANGDTTTQVIGSGTYLTGESAGGVDNATDTGNMDYAGSDEGEAEWALTIDGAQVNNNDTIDIRVRKAGGAVLATYTNTPRITVNKPAASTNQNGFRFKTDDSTGLNVNSGWEAAENTDVSLPMDKKFRIRLELEGLNGSTTDQFKLRYSKNAGAYLDVPDRADTWPPAAQGNTPVIMIVDSAQYSDGAATSDLLTSSSQSFTAGEGQNDNITGSITVNSQVTELEWTIVIPRYYDGPGTNAVNDTFDFRIYKDDNTPLDSYTRTPRVTAVLDTGHLGAVYIEQPSHVGPFWDGNGNMYFLTEHTNTSNTLLMHKSTDGGDTWNEATLTGRPTVADPEGTAVFQEGDDILHIITRRGNDVVQYHRYYMSSHSTNPDTWNVIDKQIDADAGAPSGGGSEACDICVRTSDGYIFVIYNGNDGTDDVMWWTYSTDNGANFQARSSIQTTGRDYAGGKMVLGVNTDDIYIFVIDILAGAMYYDRIQDTTTALDGTLISVATGLGTGFGQDSDNIVPPISYDDGGVEVVMVGWVNTAGDGTLSTRTLRDNTLQTTATGASDNSVDKSGGQSHQPIASFDVYNKVVHLFYSDNSTNDIYRDENNDEGGWGTDTEVHDAVTCLYIRGRVGAHSSGNGGDIVFGYVWEFGGANGDSPGFIQYNELFLAAGGTTETVDVAGALSFVGDPDQQPQIIRIGAIDFAGILLKRPSVSQDGSISPSGETTKIPEKSFDGALSFVGDLVNVAIKVLAIAGALSFSGDLVLQTGKQVAGALSSSGALVRQAQKETAGSVSPAGQTTKEAVTSYAGSLSFSGETLLTLVISMAGSLSFSGDEVNQPDKALSGTLSPTGSLTKEIVRLLVGSLSFVGDLFKQPQISQGGALSFSGALNNTLTVLITIAGALSFVGTTEKQVQKDFTGSTSPAGALLKQPQISQDGSLSFSGALNNILTVLITIAGALSFSGTLFKEPQTTQTGSLSFVGSLFKQAIVSLSGALSFSGDLTNAAQRVVSVAGSLSFSGDITNQVQKILAGVLSFVGDSQHEIPVKLVSVAGTLSFSGALTKTPGKQTAGVVSFAGYLIKQPGKLLTGALSFVGTLDNILAVLITITGALSFVGTHTSGVEKQVSGSITPAGALIKQVQRLISGALAFVGDLFNQPQISQDGSISFSGSLTNILTVLLTVTGSLSFSGDLTNQVQKLIVGALSFAGDLFKQPQVSQDGSVSPSGSLIKQVQKLFTGVLSFVGDSTHETLLKFVNVAGSLSFSGDLTNQPQIFPFGSVSFVGNLFKEVSKVFSGSVDFSGTLNNTLVALVSVAGSLSFVGSLIKTPDKQTGGNIGPVGVLVKQAQTMFSGAVSFVGDLFKQPQLSQSGSISFVGTLTNVLAVLITVSGSLSFSGVLTKEARKPLSGSVSPSGALVKQIQTLLSGSVDVSGATFMSALLLMTGSLSFSGALSNVVTQVISISGSLSFSGSIVERTVGKYITGAISPTGSVIKTIAVLFVGSIAFSGSLVLKNLGEVSPFLRTLTLATRKWTLTLAERAWTLTLPDER